MKRLLKTIKLTKKKDRKVANKKSSDEYIPVHCYPLSLHCAYCLLLIYFENHVLVRRANTFLIIYVNKSVVVWRWLRGLEKCVCVPLQTEKKIKNNKINVKYLLGHAHTHRNRWKPSQITSKYNCSSIIFIINEFILLLYLCFVRVLRSP